MVSLRKRSPLKQRLSQQRLHGSSPLPTASRLPPPRPSGLPPHAQVQQTHETAHDDGIGIDDAVLVRGRAGLTEPPPLSLARQRSLSRLHSSGRDSKAGYVSSAVPSAVPSGDEAEPQEPQGPQGHLVLTPVAPAQARAPVAIAPVAPLAHRSSTCDQSVPFTATAEAQAMVGADERRTLDKAVLRREGQRVLIQPSAGDAPSSREPGALRTSVAKRGRSGQGRRVAAHLHDFIRAAMLFLLVVVLGMAIACGVHSFNWVDGLYWTIGVLTTAGGELEASSELLQVLYILYMPLAAVTMLTIAQIIVQSTLRFRIRHDNHALHIHALLQDEARARADPGAVMREADFMLAVLKARSLIDNETLEAIRAQFGVITRRHRPRGSSAANAIVDAAVVFDHLVQQGRVLSLECYRDAHQGAEPPLAAASDDRTAPVYVHTRCPDRGFEEWFDKHWVRGVVGQAEDTSGRSDPSGTEYERLDDGHMQA